jgi:hypothetical protein
MRFSASIDADSSLRVHQHEKWSGWLSKRKGQRVEVELRDEAAIHSDRQRRYWFGVVVQTVSDIWTREKDRETPFPKEAVHGALVGAFGPEWTETPFGRERASFASMKKDEVRELIDRVAEWLKDRYGSILPSPEEWSES